VTYDPMPSRDLCYHYWEYTDKWEYCLAEPVDTLSCQVVYNREVLLILSIIPLGAISVALLLRMTQDGVYNCEDAAKLYSSKGILEERRLLGYPKTKRATKRATEQATEQADDSHGKVRWYHYRRPFCHQILPSLTVFAYLWALWAVAGMARAELVYPTDPRYVYLASLTTNLPKVPTYLKVGIRIMLTRSFSPP